MDTFMLGFAVKIEVTIDDIDVVMHQCYVLSGTALLQTSAAVGGMALPDADVTSDLAKTQFEKYQTLSRQPAPIRDVSGERPVARQPGTRDTSGQA